MTFVAARSVIAALGIEDWNYPDHSLEFPINNWLAINNRLNTRAGAVKHPKSTSKSPDEDGILLMTHFVEGPSDSNPIIEERTQDKAIKDWLIQEGGVRANELEWMSLKDIFMLTRTGIFPERDEPRVYVRKVVSDEEDRRWMEYIRDSRNPPLSLGDFLSKEDGEAGK